MSNFYSVLDLIGLHATAVPSFLATKLVLLFQCAAFAGNSSTNYNCCWPGNYLRQMFGTFLPLPLVGNLVNSTRRLILDGVGLLPSTLLIQIRYRKDEGYAKNIPALCQAQEIYKFNILSAYWEQNRLLFWHRVCSAYHWIVLLAIFSSLTTLVTD